MVTVATAAGLIAAFWLALAIHPLRRFPRDHFLRAPAPAGTPPRVAVLIPARDEAAMLPQTLPSLLEQEYPNFEVIVIDDGSSDGTPRVAEEIAQAYRRSGSIDTAGAAGRTREAPRFRLLAAGEKPPGWAGKLHALERGVEAAVIATEPALRPVWLLLTDADIRHPKTSIASLVAKAQRGGYDLVSVMARLSTAGAWEKLLIPPFVYFFHLLYPFRGVSLRSSKMAAAAGGCVLVRATSLLDAGGFGAIRDALIDDVALARLLKARKRRLWLGLDAEIESVRRYTLLDLWRMVTRSAFVQLGYRYALPPLVMTGLAFFFAGPSVIVVASVAAIALGAGSVAAWVAFALAALARVLETLAILPWVRHHRIRQETGWALTLPLAALFYGAMTVGSAWNHLRGRGSAWKGRGYEPRMGADTFTSPR
jgi:hopene-associated glycosyltransferase HpnB